MGARFANYDEQVYAAVMRFFLLIGLFLNFSLTYAQQIIEEKKVVEDSIYNYALIDKKPEYPQGIKAFYQYIGEHFVPPKDTIFKGGRLITSFIIEKDGKISNVKILRDIGYGTAEETIRVLKECSPWIPGEHQGNKVRVLNSIPISIQASVKIATEDNDNLIQNADKIEIKPSFPGGLEKFYKYIGKSFRTPSVEGLKGKIFVTFVVEKDGSITDIKILRDIGHGTGEEAIRVLKNSPKWIAGEIAGKKVRVLYSLPIAIETTNNNFDNQPANPFQTYNNSNSRFNSQNNLAK